MRLGRWHPVVIKLRRRHSFRRPLAELAASGGIALRVGVQLISAGLRGPLPLPRQMPQGPRSSARQLQGLPSGRRSSRLRRPARPPVYLQPECPAGGRCLTRHHATLREPTDRAGNADAGRASSWLRCGPERGRRLRRMGFRRPLPSNPWFSANRSIGKFANSLDGHGAIEAAVGCSRGTVAKIAKRSKAA